VGGDQDPTWLIHVGAREFDPLLGWFLSVGPRIRRNLTTESWNNYAYANNSSLTCTDPSGKGWGWLKKAVSVVATVASVAQGLASACPSRS
jgi:RHS repeat-associated protein